MREVTFTLPLPPNVANGRGHWTTRRRIVDEWMTRAIVEEPKLRRATGVMQRATLSAVMYVGNHPRHIRDDDNAVASLKPVGDLLVRRGFVPDDRRPYLSLGGIPEQRLGTPRRLELTLRELA